MRASSAVVALVLSALLAAAVPAFELPEEMYSHMRGTWNVEIASPCMPVFLSGAVHISNASSVIVLPESAGSSKDVQLTQPSGESFDEVGALRLTGLESFLFGEADSTQAKLGYKTCLTQTNLISTEKRPMYGKEMATTQLTEMVGVLVPSNWERDRDPCAASAGGAMQGDVVIHIIGMPMTGVAREKDLRQREAAQYVEIMINTRNLPGSCAAAAHKSDAAAADGAEKKRTRKRRGLRNALGTTDLTSEDAETAVANGFVIIRFSKKSVARKTFLQQFFPSLLFAGLFIAYRILYGFFSNRSSK